MDRPGAEVDRHVFTVELQRSGLGRKPGCCRLSFIPSLTVFPVGALTLFTAFISSRIFADFLMCAV